ECGSQNWSDNFMAEFKKRRGYDLQPFLLTMTGVPIDNAETSEKVLYDVRQTIAELVNDVFYATVTKLAHEKGCSFSAEAIAPTMVSDGLLHYKHADLPMGEFWLNSPTHDKPNDMLDAVSGAHIYGKRIIQSESFTSVLMNWGEHPGNMKTVGDRNFALGINKMVIHVFTHNPWMNKKPGMTLGSTGLYFQRDQTWFKQSKAWIEYLTRCQALLQMGKPVVDIAVFTGEEVPRRSVLPDRLVSTLPGIFGKERVEAEKIRLANKGEPLRQIPDGVSHSANMADPEDWIDPLNGYAYDSFNPDVLMRMKVVNGRVVLPGGASYKILVIPAERKLNPAFRINTPSLKKIVELVKNGATVLVDSVYSKGLITAGYKANQPVKGKLIFTPYTESSFAKLGLEKDVEILDTDHTIAWTHRKTGNADIYFIANQKDSLRQVRVYLRGTGKVIELWDPLNGRIISRYNCRESGGYVYADFWLVPNESVFVVLTKNTVSREIKAPHDRIYTIKRFRNFGPWTVTFNKNYGGPAYPLTFNGNDSLPSWSSFEAKAVKYYSGTAVYSTLFNYNENSPIKSAILQFDNLYDIATVKVNGINCGTIWTKPYDLDIAKALKPGRNKIEIEVSNTWTNRLIGDEQSPIADRVTWTTAPFRLKGKPLLSAGIIGRIFLDIETE
ncbi:MAG: DNA-binding protein, partial [Chitinophagaceae bacterium]|nr:DNA-binding protein [Chitinophagaceae bacterium]